jgi:hypothetical protein
MEQKLDWEFLNWDKELGSVRKAVRNLRNVSVEAGPEVRAYIKALKALNAEMSRRLDLYQGGTGTPGKARRSLHKTRKPRGSTEPRTALKSLLVRRRADRRAW